MNLADVGRAIARHPVWLAVGAVLAVFAGGLTFTAVSPVRQSTASVVILPPVLGDTTSEQNPFLNLDNTLAQLATIVSSALTSGSTQDRLAAQGDTAAYTVANTTSDNPSFAQLSPELQFTVTDADAGNAERTAAALVEEAGTVLAGLQDGAQVGSQFRARVVTVAEPSGASVAGNGQLRAGGGVFLIVLVLTVAVVVLFDVGASRRARNRQLSSDLGRYRPGGGEDDVTSRRRSASRVRS